MPSKQIIDLQSLTAAASGTITLVSDNGVTKQMALSVINHNLITNKGTNTHTALDTELALTVAHRANISNPHSVTKTQIGLSAVTNDAQVKVSDIGTTVLAPSGNGSGLTGIVISDTIANITGNTAITAAQMTGRIRFYNSAQAAITLPAATAGLTATFEINHSGGIRFIRNGSDTFACGGASSLTALPGGTNYDIVVGGLYELTCYVAGVWTAKRKGVQPSFDAYMSNDQTLTAGNTWYKLQFNSEVSDNNNEYDSTTNYRHSPLIPGKYDYTMLACGTDQWVDIAIYKDNILNKRMREEHTNYDTISHNLSYDIEHNGSNYCEAYGKVSNATAIFYGGTTLSMFKAVRRPD